MSKVMLALTLSLLSISAWAEEDVLIKNTVTLSGTVVGSACSIVVDNGVSRNGIINLGVYNHLQKAEQVGIPFQVKLFEPGAVEAGCSAFLAGRGFVKFQFGDNQAGQLDEQGVVTHGAGDSVRIDIRSTDTNYVSSAATITSENSELLYQKDFASKGVFGFNAKAIGLDKASAGEYRGSLSLVVSYQ